MQINYKIELYAPCYNESAILPFILDYWRHIGITHIYIFDNYSTDGSDKILAKYPDWITVNKIFSDNTLKSDLITDIKQTYWQSSTADFAFLQDIDEILWCDDYPALFDYMIQNNYDIAQGIGTQIISQEFPEYSSDILLHKNPNMKFYFDKMFSKASLIRPSKIKTPGYSVGCHSCRPKKKDGSPAKILSGLDYPGHLHFLHFKNFGFDYLLKKRRSSGSRLSENNKKRGWGIHNNMSDRDIKLYFEKNFKLAKNNLKDVIP